MKIITIFLLVVYYAGIGTGVSRHRWDQRESHVSCADDVKNFCSDCKTANFCNGGEQSSYTLCNDEYACFGNGQITGCFDISDVPECQCPSEGTTILPDPYDNQKFILCIDGGSSIEKCPDDTYFHPDSGNCEVGLPPSTTTKPPLEECNGQFEVVAVSCTSYRICHTDGATQMVMECEPGYYFDMELDECVKYEPFSCPYEDEYIYYADNHNCSLFYVCYQGNISGQVLNCSPGQVFDNALQTCTDDTSGCSAVEDCGICPDDQTRFAVDCQRYYQCTGSVTGDLDYVPVLTYCGSGLYFDPQTGECSETVLGCPQQK